MKRCFGLLVIVMLLLASGCIDYDEVMVINPDGSGTVKMHYAMNKIYFEQLDAMMQDLSPEESEASTGSPSDMFSKQDIEEALAGNDQGIKLVSFNYSETDSLYIWDMEFSFQDIHKLNYLSEALSSSEGEYMTPEEGGQSYSKQEDGTWLFTRSLGSDENPDAGEFQNEEEGEENPEAYDDQEPEEESEGGQEGNEFEDGMQEFADAMQGLGSEMQWMAEEMKNHKIRFTIIFPHKVIESNATNVDGDTATWEYTLDKMSEAPPEMRAVVAGK
jgi:hypothetical protein